MKLLRLLIAFIVSLPVSYVPTIKALMLYSAWTHGDCTPAAAAGSRRRAVPGNVLRDQSAALETDLVLTSVRRSGHMVSFVPRSGTWPEGVLADFVISGRGSRMPTPL